MEARNSFGGSVGRICEIFVDRVVVPLLRGGNAAGFDMTDGEHYFRMDLANGRTDSRNFVRRKSRRIIADEMDGAKYSKNAQSALFSRKLKLFILHR